MREQHRIFAEMSALAAAHRLDQPRAGLPRHRRARRGRSRRPSRAIRGGPQPVPARPRHPRAARGDRRAPAAASTASTSTRTPRSSSPPAPPRRSPPRCSPSSSRATRWSRSSRTTTPYAAAIALAGGVAAHGHAARARLPRSTPARCGRRSPPRTRVILLNSPHNPTGKVLHPRRARRGRRARASSTTWSWSPTRSTSTWSSTAREHVPIATLPGMAERTLTISSARQDVLVHRLEGRLGHRPAPSWSPRCGPPSSS